MAAKLTLIKGGREIPVAAGPGPHQKKMIEWAQSLAEDQAIRAWTMVLMNYQTLRIPAPPT